MRRKYIIVSSLVAVIALAIATFVYAATILVTDIELLGGTGNVIVEAPTDSLEIGWELDENGRVRAVLVTWTPEKDSDYTIYATVNESNGSTKVTNSKTHEREDRVAVTPLQDAKDINSTNIIIKEDK